MKTLHIFLIIFIFYSLACKKEENNDSKPSSLTQNMYVPVPNSLISKTKNQLSNAFVSDIDTLYLDSLPKTLYDKLLLFFPFDDKSADDNGPLGIKGIIECKPNINGNFNDPNDSTYIKIPNDGRVNFLNQPFTICAWFYGIKNDNVVQAIFGKCRNGDNTGTGILLSIANNYGVGGIDTTYVRFDVNDGNNQVSSIFFTNKQWLLNTWHFVVGSFNGNTLKLYVDGELRSTEIANLNFNDENYFPSYIGREIYENTEIRYFYGAIDNVMIFNSILSDSDILTLYQLRESR